MLGIFFDSFLPFPLRQGPSFKPKALLADRACLASQLSQESLLCLLRLGLHAGHHANPAFYTASQDPNSGPYTCVAKCFNHGVISRLLCGLCTPRTCSPSVSALRVGVTGMFHHEWPLPAFLSSFCFLRQDLFMQPCPQTHKDLPVSAS